MLGLSEMQEPWPCGGWILRVFVRIMDKFKNRSTENAANAISRIRDDSAANLASLNMECSTEIQGQKGQAVHTLIDQNPEGNIQGVSNSVGLENQMDPGQFSLDDGSFTLDMLNEPDYFFPGDLGQDLASQIPYFREFSMLGA